METSDVETVLVAGASGDTGREVLGLLGPRVPTVRALTRSPEKRRSLRRAGHRRGRRRDLRGRRTPVVPGPRGRD